MRMVVNMAYDQNLARRMRTLLADHPIEEKNMFGGLAFFVGGHMACGVIKNDLVVRVGAQGYEDALAEPGARLFDFTSRPMKGWVMVSSPGYLDDDALLEWVMKGITFAKTLPPK